MVMRLKDRIRQLVEVESGRDRGSDRRLLAEGKKPWGAYEWKGPEKVVMGHPFDGMPKRVSAKEVNSWAKKNAKYIQWTVPYEKSNIYGINRRGKEVYDRQGSWNMDLGVTFAEGESGKVVVKLYRPTVDRQSYRRNYGDLVNAPPPGVVVSAEVLEYSFDKTDGYYYADDHMWETDYAVKVPKWRQTDFELRVVD